MRHFTVALKTGGSALESPGHHPGQGADTTCLASTCPRSASPRRPS